MNTKIVHATGDEALGLLSAAQNAGSSLVRSFPGKEDSEHPNWLDMWFLTRIEQHYNGTITDEDKKFSFDVPTKQSDIAPHALPVRLEWVQANYFRGFREAVTTINMSDDLMVLEGANSCGDSQLRLLDRRREILPGGGSRCCKRTLDRRCREPVTASSKCSRNFETAVTWEEVSSGLDRARNALRNRSF